VRKLRTRCSAGIYSLGPAQSSEVLALEVRHRRFTATAWHIRMAKVGKDPLRSDAALTLEACVASGRTHRHPRLLFPSPAAANSSLRIASATDGCQRPCSGTKAARLEAGIEKRLTFTSAAARLRHAPAGEQGMEPAPHPVPAGHSHSKTPQPATAHITKVFVRDPTTGDRIETLLERLSSCAGGES